MKKLPNKSVKYLFLTEQYNPEIATSPETQHNLQNLDSCILKLRFSESCECSQEPSSGMSGLLSAKYLCCWGLLFLCKMQ